MTESKKKWVTPELIVLVQTSPQEAVLVGCKKITRPTGNSTKTCSYRDAVCSRTTTS